MDTSEASIENILKSFKLEKYLNAFEEEEIELEDLKHLSEATLAKLFPKDGPMCRFKRKYSEFIKNGAGSLKVETSCKTNENIVVVVGEDLANGCTIFRPVEPNGDVTPPPVLHDAENDAGNDAANRSAFVDVDLGEDLVLQVTNSPPRKKSKESPELVEQILAKNVIGKAVAAIGKKKLLSGNHKVQLELGALVILAEFGNDPQKVIPPKRMIELADAICKAFPDEVKATYYVPRVPGTDGEKAVLPKGILYDKYITYGRFLREAGVRDGNKSTATEDGSTPEIADEATEKLVEWLRTCTASEEVALPKWTATHDYRFKELQKSSGKPTKKSKIKQDKVNTYFENYKLLKRAWGYKLLLADFDLLYANKSTLLIDSWPSIAQKITALAKVNLEQNESGLEVEVLKLIPGLFRQPILVHPYNKKDKSLYWKPSSCESEQGFLLHVKVTADLESAIDRLKKKCESVKQTLQPFPAVVGVGENFVCYIVLDSVRYRVGSPIEAVDTCFKLFQALHAEYPVHASYAWLFLQKAVYNIDTKWDPVIPSVETAVNRYRNL